MLEKRAISAAHHQRNEPELRPAADLGKSTFPPGRYRPGKAAAVAAARFYAGRIRSALAGMAHRPRSILLSGTTSRGADILLRPPRPADARTWRAIRLRDRPAIEPFWITVSQDWESRHTERAWVRECLQPRSDAKAGRVVRTVIEVDGHLAGQCELWVESFDRRGELGIWIDSRLSGQGYATAAGRLMLAYAFAELDLARVTAPTDFANSRAARWADRIGMTCEGRMAAYQSVGGRRRDHDLWAITAQTWHVEHAPSSPISDS